MKRRTDLDGLRGTAVISVIVLHTVFAPFTLEAETLLHSMRFAIQPFLIAGVDLFFVLSGFLIGGILMDNKGATNFFTTFWRRRICRIFPVYYLMYFVVIMIYIWDSINSSTFTQSLLKDQLPFWTYATFTQNFYMVFNESRIHWNFLGLTWSFAIEEQFYLLLPPAVYLFRRVSIFRAAIFLILLAPFVRAIVWENYGWWANYFLSPSRMDTVMWGIVIAFMVRQEKIISLFANYRRVVDIIIIILAALVASDAFTYFSASFIDSPDLNLRLAGLFISTLRYSALAAMFALILFRLFLPGAHRLSAILSNPILTKAGLISYAAYMYHQFINNVTHRVIHGGTVEITSWQYAYIPVLVIFLIFVASTLSYRFMEKPIQDWGRRKKYLHESS